MSESHSILMITTGGTIAGNVAVSSDEENLIQGADDFCELISKTINYLQQEYKLTIDIKSTHLCNVDSSDITPNHWKDIVTTIKSEYDNFDSFIITHGTNTLGYTCAALSFAIENSNKPIILTGSQVPAGLPGSDAITNLENAVRVAVWRREGAPIKGVIAVFGSHIMTGTRVKKNTEFDYDAFESFGAASIGRIGRIININEQNLTKHTNYLSTNRFPIARKSKELRCKSNFDMSIASITEFPGMSTDLFKSMVENNGVHGFVLRAFGAGDPCTGHLRAFEYLKCKEIPIVVTTQAPNGNSNFQVNKPGQILRERELAIPAYDMSIEAQTTKLAWLLGRKQDGELNYSQICNEMIHDVRGEINVMWEVGV